MISIPDLNIHLSTSLPKPDEIRSGVKIFKDFNIFDHLDGILPRHSKPKNR